MVAICNYTLDVRRHPRRTARPRRQCSTPVRSADRDGGTASGHAAASDRLGHGRGAVPAPRYDGQRLAVLRPRFARRRASGPVRERQAGGHARSARRRRRLPHRHPGAAPDDGAGDRHRRTPERPARRRRTSPILLRAPEAPDRDISASMGVYRDTVGELVSEAIAAEVADEYPRPPRCAASWWSAFPSATCSVR